MSDTKGTTTINGIGHIALNVRDMEKSIKFYCDVLGLKHAFTLRDANDKPWIEYLKVADNNFIELFYAKPIAQAASLSANSPDNQGEGSDNSKFTSFHHICLTVGDIHAAEKALDNAGWTVDTRPKQGADLNWQMWASDPDGNKLELMQISPDSLQAKS